MCSTLAGDLYYHKDARISSIQAGDISPYKVPKDARVFSVLAGDIPPYRVPKDARICSILAGDLYYRKECPNTPEYAQF